MQSIEAGHGFIDPMVHPNQGGFTSIGNYLLDYLPLLVRKTAEYVIDNLDSLRRFTDSYP